MGIGKLRYKGGADLKDGKAKKKRGRLSKMLDFYKERIDEPKQQEAIRKWLIEQQKKEKERCKKKNGTAKGQYRKEDFANKIMVSLSTFKRKMKGERNFTYEELEILTEWMGQGPEDVIGIRLLSPLPIDEWQELCEVKEQLEDVKERFFSIDRERFNFLCENREFLYQLDKRAIFSMQVFRERNDQRREVLRSFLECVSAIELDVNLAQGKEKELWKRAGEFAEGIRKLEEKKKETGADECSSRKENWDNPDYRADQRHRERRWEEIEKKLLGEQWYKGIAKEAEKRIRILYEGLEFWTNGTAEEFEMLQKYLSLSCVIAYSNDRKAYLLREVYDSILEAYAGTLCVNWLGTDRYNLVELTADIKQCCMDNDEKWARSLYEDLKRQAPNEKELWEEAENSLREKGWI